ncbi:helix-turn-helix domain-containing protein [Streptomyces hoynatensis]|uniref:Helix-turn-helix domain-containing protein n=1 Tax=Streptomyces hoynatensis TaxID=1141874 RepID=A0A3A9YNI2_9ACTN|nr:XRE family transcriptional regulator [Streptomyces hoynatensis]RKN36984.1 helix-turn-helix domain-containing protein [Streptomyces hoynatensis]
MPVEGTETSSENGAKGRARPPRSAARAPRQAAEGARHNAHEPPRAPRTSAGENAGKNADKNAGKNADKNAGKGAGKRPARTGAKRAAQDTTPAGGGDRAGTDADQRAELGASIRRLRKERGLTLVQLAQRAELSHPFLSQLERGLTHPSMPSLHRIARALGTTQQALLANAVRGSADVSPAEIRVVRSGEGLPVTNLGGVARMLGTPRHGVHPVEYRGAQTVFGGYYDHPGDEFLYVIAGEVEVDLHTAQGPVLHRLGPGDSISYLGGTPHRWRAVAEGESVRLLAVQNATAPADPAAPSPAEEAHRTGHA